MLTERRIRDAKPEVRTRTLRDAQVKGLGLGVAPAGTKSYILDYRVAGRERRATLARASELSLKAARACASEELAAIRAEEADLSERRRETKVVPTVADGLQRFFSEYASARIEIGRMTARTVKGYRQQALQYLVPALGKREVREVNRRDVEVMVESLAKESLKNPCRDSGIYGKPLISRSQKRFKQGATGFFRPSLRCGAIAGWRSYLDCSPCSRRGSGVLGTRTPHAGSSAPARNPETEFALRPSSRRSHWR